MDPVDEQGVVYSAAGLRFGGFRTDQFLAATSDLEAASPGARAMIVAEAHHTCYWLYRFGEFAFLGAVADTKSVWLGMVAFLGAYAYEFVRFQLFGTSAFIAYVSWAWRWLKTPLFLVVAVLMWPENPSIAVVLAAFLVLQGWMGLLNPVVLLPLRSVLTLVVLRTVGRASPQVHNIEGMALTCAIDRRRLQARRR